MIFSTPEFFLFFSVFLFLHIFCPPRFRLYLMIAASAVFYASWKIEFIWLPFFMAFVAYIATLWIEVAKNEVQKKMRLTISLIVLFTPLAIFKYFDFFYSKMLQPLTGLEEFQLKFALPLGISFMTFTLAAYVVDIAVKKFPLQRNFLQPLSFVIFFPHLIAGPILRPHELIPQFGNFLKNIKPRYYLAFGIFTLGLVKKLVFADQMAPLVEETFSGNSPENAWAYMLAFYGFSIQIYCDFSGYTDMAVGAAMMMGIRLPTNFRSPYGSASIIEFWRRWHITLSHWLRDYLYIALGGSRRGRARHLANLLITMVLGGLWHGANWTFIIWGALHGVALVLNHQMRGLPIRIPRWISIFVIFHFVTFAWVFFRAPDLTTALQVLAGPFIYDWSNPGEIFQAHSFIIFLSLVFIAIHRFDNYSFVRFALKRVSGYVMVPVLATLWVLAITVSQGSSASFVYFDF
ncbi:MAG: hypothetical protein P1U69_13745 [Parvibaculaceae bacterium]|nr:hypothetical protein [Parvibaculaceae bacterium]|tara:strand:- start:11707 stop:13089 length:1383 start_codon:yes stop_codon:yes gene_type:complete